MMMLLVTGCNTMNDREPVRSPQSDTPLDNNVPDTNKTNIPGTNNGNGPDVNNGNMPSPNNGNVPNTNNR